MSVGGFGGRVAGRFFGRFLEGLVFQVFLVSQSEADRNILGLGPGARAGGLGPEAALYLLFRPPIRKGIGVYTET